MDELFLDPLKYYETEAKGKILGNSDDYFEDLLKKSGIDADANRESAKKYRTENETVNTLNGKISKYKALRVLMILLSIVGVILFFVGIFSVSAYVGVGIALIIGGAALVAFSIYFWFGKINKIIKDSSSVRDEHRKKADEYLKECQAQVAPLNSMFDNTDTFKVIEKTLPEIKFNSLYTPKHEKFLIEHYDFAPIEDENISVMNVLSGTFASNPFLYYRYKRHTLGTQTYVGTLTIHWTETYTDRDGRTRTRTRTQTLTASVTKPKPFYTIHTTLGFGAQAAPDLSFSRSPSHAERFSEKSLERKVNSGAKKLEKQARKATSHGGNFQEMANSEFDVLFGARDRNNEVQFRVMYTPLAQRNTTDLMKSATGYGDDFYFAKQGRFNMVSSEHAASWKMNTSASNYYSYDVDIIKKNFIDFNAGYFKSVYFDFAPLIAIPVYTEEPSFSLDNTYESPSNYTAYEHETLANAIGKDAFVHKNSSTDAILKTEFSEKQGSSDILSVTAHSYETFNRVDIIPVLGGDGRIHGVPVPWIEYIPLENTVNMSVKDLNMSEKEFASSNQSANSSENWAFCHGMIANII